MARAGCTFVLVAAAMLMLATEAWAHSPKHCANLMSPLFEEVGLACVERKGSRFERFWVAQLGRR